MKRQSDNVCRERSEKQCEKFGYSHLDSAPYEERDTRFRKTSAQLQAGQPAATLLNLAQEGILRLKSRRPDTLVFRFAY